ncbi:alpha/beta hydrolase family esterase [Paucibacter sp. Y2R2-4]|uniref:extracellular catalytic domain type 1 short-chain-length polyhydroxyalkanoate depolymerase n=1 Tax=Paucibacter sp. Y2R2-4 TaxID=2893553 RepID=UPI0021E42879|nr:PHB depolymerase family esterase [Paucibacter sp. Y2R2-4]MCV2349419.1 PHB depolymerase family esterase [Paucibacter sp. Y2R2-4]
MAKRSVMSVWAGGLQRSLQQAARRQMQLGAKALSRSIKSASKPKVAAASAAPAPKVLGDWLSGVAMSTAGARRFKLYRPPLLLPGERLPLLLMLHGCGQTANAFAISTRMNSLAARERFMVLYPEQDRLANPQACWNWFDTASGKAYGEAGLILRALDQVCARHPVDRSRVAVAGLSAGASMAALLAIRHPERFKAVVMHSGVPPGTAHSGITALGAMKGRRATRSLAVSAAAMGLTPGPILPPLLVIHGGRDLVVADDNAHAAVQAWAEATGARAGLARQQGRGKRYPMQVTDFKAGPRIAARLVEVGLLAHAWSGGAKSQAFSDPQGPDASRLLWRFVLRQFAC